MLQITDENNMGRHELLGYVVTIRVILEPPRTRSRIIAHNFRRIEATEIVHHRRAYSMNRLALFRFMHRSSSAEG